MIWHKAPVGQVWAFRLAKSTRPEWLKTDQNADPMLVAQPTLGLDCRQCGLAYRTPPCILLKITNTSSSIFHSSNVWANTHCQMDNIMNKNTKRIVESLLALSDNSR
jgi:hypothetical protein